MERQRAAGAALAEPAAARDMSVARVACDVCAARAAFAARPARAARASNAALHAHHSLAGSRLRTHILHVAAVIARYKIIL